MFTSVGLINSSRADSVFSLYVLVVGLSHVRPTTETQKTLSQRNFGVSGAITGPLVGAGNELET